MWASRPSCEMMAWPCVCRLTMKQSSVEREITRGVRSTFCALDFTTNNSMPGRRCVTMKPQNSSLCTASVSGCTQVAQIMSFQYAGRSLGSTLSVVKMRLMAIRESGLRTAARGSESELDACQYSPAPRVNARQQNA